MYYLRTRPAADPIQFTIDKNKANSLVVGDHVRKLYESQGSGNISRSEILQNLTLKGQESMYSLVNKESCESCQG